MKNKIMAEMSYPPPPPPPSPGGNSRKTLVVSLLIVLVVVSAIVLAYLATGGFAFNAGNTNPSPSASPTEPSTAHPSTSSSSTSSSSPKPSNTATATSNPTATPQPSATQGNDQTFTNFRAGQWVNYTLTIYEAGASVSEAKVKESVDEGSYKGTACWLLIVEQDSTYEGAVISTTKTITYYQKNNMQGLHTKIYINGNLFQEYDLNETSTTDPGSSEINPDTIISYEDITVPAGSFAHCAKARTTTEDGYVEVWGHETVPIFGVVKMNMYNGSERVMSEVLTAYDG